MKKQTSAKIRVNATEHAKALYRANGGHRALHIAKAMVETANSMIPSKMHNEKEIASLKGFWTTVAGVLGKAVK